MRVGMGRRGRRENERRRRVEKGGSWVRYGHRGWVEREMESRGMRGLKENKIK